MSQASVEPEPKGLSELQDWAANFKNKHYSAYAADGKLLKKRPISELLEVIKKKPLARGTHDRLVANILHACFMAADAPDPETDEAAEHRKQLTDELNRMRVHKEDVVRVRIYLDDHPDMANRAMAHASPSGAYRRHSVTKSTSSRLNDLRSMLSEYENGLHHLGDSKNLHPAHSSADDFRYGPFELDLDNNDLYNLAPKLKDINQTGLIFHLTYLFRYFTTNELPPLNIEIGKFLWAQVEIGREILDVSGIMLSSGRPHADLVAPLVNTVFKSKLSASNVKDRLRDLYRFSEGTITKAKFPKARKLPLFVGWR
jgi:hypothetical protein